MPPPVEQVQSDWNQNDENASDYIKNRPFKEELIPIWTDTQLKFNNGSISIIIESNDPVLLQGNSLQFQSLDPNLIISYNGGNFSPDGKGGSSGFTIYDLNGNSQGGGGISISFNSGTNKYIYSVSGTGNPSVVANLEFKVFKQLIYTLNSKFIPSDIARKTDILQPHFLSIKNNYTLTKEDNLATKDLTIDFNLSLLLTRDFDSTELYTNTLKKLHLSLRWSNTFSPNSTSYRLFIIECNQLNDPYGLYNLNEVTWEIGGSTYIRFVRHSNGYYYNGIECFLGDLLSSTSWKHPRINSDYRQNFIF